MGTYATREDAVDELLRRNVFINLHTVVRQGLRAGVDSYSLKEVEALAAFARRADVRSGMDAVLAYEKWIKSQDAAIACVDRRLQRGRLPRDACAAGLARRAPSRGQGVGGRHRSEGGRRSRMTANATQLRQRLVEGEEPGSVRWLAGELLEYHQREARPAWWWYFMRRDLMTEEELFDDAEAISGLEPTGEAVPDKKSLIHTLRFPAQQHKLSAGQATGRSGDQGVAGDDRRHRRRHRHAPPSPRAEFAQRTAASCHCAGRSVRHVVPSERRSRGLRRLSLTTTAAIRRCATSWRGRRRESRGGRRGSRFRPPTSPSNER